MTNTKPVFLPASADALARLHTAEAVGFQVQLIRGEIEGAKVADRLRASEAIIERGHGKAVQAVIQVPQRAAMQAKLAALTDDELLAIATAGGSGGGKRGPMPVAGGEGTIQPSNDPNGQQPSATSHQATSNSSQELNGQRPGPRSAAERIAFGLVPRLPSRFAKADVVDGEVEDGYDPLG